MSASGQLLREIIENFAPRRFAMDGDKTGLQVGSFDRSFSKVLTTLDVTPEVVQEAVDNKVDLIVSHHAVVFRPLKDLRTDNPKGALLETLIKNDIAVYVPHTAMDITSGGINDQLAALFDLEDARYLKETGRDASVLLACSEQAGEALTTVHCVASRSARSEAKQFKNFHGVEGYQIPLDSHSTPRGIGRIGRLKKPLTLQELADTVLAKLSAPFLRMIGSGDKEIKKVALLCGDGNRFLHDAQRQGADVLITGDVYYHTALEAKAMGIAILDPGHNATERLVGPLWKDILDKGLSERKVSDVEVMASKIATEPFTVHVAS
ncbi:MAG: Nif3-like dinuclear metal center hexameric protein [Planctomycetota bacterium]|nr:Nif3-like dinuclear metal center hexameric protein [Planctomycetota bacterium]